MRQPRAKTFPVILLDLHENDGLMPFVAAEARLEGLRFFDITQTNETIPSDYDVTGVISCRPAIQRPYQSLLADEVPVIRTGTYIYPQTNDDPIVMSEKKIQLVSWRQSTSFQEATVLSALAGLQGATVSA